MSLISHFQNYDYGPKAWRDLYQKLDVDTAALVRRRKLTAKIAVSRMNADKNRYTNVLPYDQNRVQLTGDNDYINASHVTVEKAKRNYILCQGPVEESLADFWQMIFEYNVPAIVMLNKLFEGGSLKCEKYYPCVQNPVMIFGGFAVQNVNEKQLQNFISRKLIIKNTETDEERTVVQVQYTEWPDFGVPVSAAHFLEMLDYIKSLGVLSKELDDPPVVVHCSAGIGRSGTFVLVDSVLHMIELGVPEAEIDPNDLLIELRTSRMGLIQTPEQLQFAWTAIVDGVQKIRAAGDAVVNESRPCLINNDGARKRRSEPQDDVDDRTAKRKYFCCIAKKDKRISPQETWRCSDPVILETNRLYLEVQAKPQVDGAPDDTVQAIKFSPAGAEAPMLAAGSWDGVVRVWMLNENGQCEAKAQQTIPAPILDIDWTDDGARIFIAAADNDVRLWDLASNQIAVVGAHTAPVKTCHWIKAPSYSCLMTGSWDKTLRFWDMRNLPQQTQMALIELPERVYAADVVYPMAVVLLANKTIKVYSLENGPTEYKTVESQLKHQHRCIAIFKDKTNAAPIGFGVGSIEGRVGIQVLETGNHKDNFTFKCHRSAELVNNYQEIYGVNGIAFHPQHGTLVTIGGDGKYSLWDKDARTKLSTSEVHPMPLTCVDIHCSGQIMAYAVGYDWSRGHEGNTQPGSKIVLHKCFDDMQPKKK